MALPFHPRLRFPFPTRTPSWFAGHMARSLNELPNLLKDIDLVIEARDARLPLTSVNSAFDDVLRTSWGLQSNDAGRIMDVKGKQREKLVVYTKRDLAESRFEKPLKKAFLEHANQKVLFADTRSDKDVRSILKHAVDHAKQRYDAVYDMNILVVGMPNVGKSSLLNALRRVGVHKGKAFRIGAEPGITRRLTGTVKINETPPVYVYDTPGVMMSYLGKGERGAEKGLKLALTAGIKASLFEPDILADYLLYRLNLRSLDPTYPSYLNNIPLPPSFTTPTNDLTELLIALATRIGAMRAGGELDLETAQRFFLRAFQEGKFGQWTLDDLLERPGMVISNLESADTISISSEAENDVQPPQLPTPATITAAADIDALVSARVKTFLAEQAREQARRDEGISESSTQEKKKELAKLKAERQAKWEAKVARRKELGDGLGGRTSRSTTRARRK
ncbi:hypothetical protein QFC21_001308 [Naganishia friedmannii]|uniref:Uncharacterized protein n=1 Tax=Naganishia friedmannii TaxID=89922 RepID=A0ACC2W354_9TREE|nr:hypothetical protein QFC21_001308 [Naganishia friedmannii]